MLPSESTESEQLLFPEAEERGTRQSLPTEKLGSVRSVYQTEGRICAGGASNMSLQVMWLKAVVQRGLQLAHTGTSYSTLYVLHVVPLLQGTRLQS